MNPLTARRPAPSPLQQLLGGVSIDEFRGEIFERKPYHFSGALGADYIGRLFCLKQMDDLFSNVDLRYPHVEVIENGSAGFPPTLRSGVVDRVHLLSKLRQGASIRIREIHGFEPRLMELARGLALELLASVNVNAYITPPARTGFNPHFDDHDVFILQCFGEKQWVINRTYERQIELPNARILPSADDRKRASDPESAEQFLLREGDVLYLPRGTLHYASATVKGSIHLTIGCTLVTKAQLLRLAINRAERSRPDFRRAAYGDLVHSSSGRLVESLNELIDHVDLVDGIVAARDETCASSPAPTDGMLSEIFAAVDIAETTRFALRANGTFTLQRDQTGLTVEILTPHMQLTLHESEKAYFNKIESQGIFCPRDIADGEMSGCMEFLTQLFRHGVINVVGGI